MHKRGWGRGIGFSAVLALLATSACLESGTHRCGSFVCPTGTVCAPSGSSCVLSEQVEGCVGKDDEAACAYQGVPRGVCYSGVCLPSGCGNGELDSDEVCDDGNQLSGDGCSADCRSDETCGNGVIDAPVGEACDDGRHCEDGTACLTDADCPGIGDERCLGRDGDLCQASCASPTCGDGVVDAQFNEACDCGVDGADLPSGCSAANSAAPDASCRQNCQLPRCGDGVEDPSLGEICDDGDQLSGNGCSFDCLSTEICGNDYVDPAAGEVCDEGVLGLRGDGCDFCALEAPRWAAGGANAPPALVHAGLAYQVSKARTLLFGGDDSVAFYGGTWEFDGERWREHTLGVNPSARRLHSMAYDQARDQVVLFGGQAFGGNVGDTHLWDGAQWTQASPAASPPARLSSAMVYDSGRARTVLFGGNASAPGTPDLMNDTWEWDGTTWSPITPNGEAPAPRRRHAMAYDSARGVTVLFGGFPAEAGRLADTWEYDGDTATWTPITPDTTVPPSRADHAMVYDPVRGRVLMTGGLGEDGPLLDVWEWDGQDWNEITQTGTVPDLLRGHRMVYDAATAQVVLFGGEDASGESDATWTWNGVSEGWLQKGQIANALARTSASTAYDAGTGRVVLFGGYNESNTDVAETWEWDGARWTEVTPEGASPAALANTAVAYDAAAGVHVLFGGFDDSWVGAAETWEWDSANRTWTPRSPLASPPGRGLHAMAYDPLRKKVIAFGGKPAAFGSDRLNDTWEWDRAANTWEEITVPGPLPSERSSMRLVTDPARGRVVMFGGTDGEILSETWEWDGSAATWSEVLPAGDVPAARASHGMTYNANRQRVFLFGGRSSSDSLFRDAWEWDGQSWKELALSESTPARRFLHQVSYDAARARVIVHSGGGGLGVILDDTSEFTYRRDGATEEDCHSGTDADGDSLVACDDPDCWAFCTPFCGPGAVCDPNAPRCGDSVCNPHLEGCRLCPSDCGPCVECGDFSCSGAEDAGSCPGDCS